MIIFERQLLCVRTVLGHLNCSSKVSFEHMKNVVEKVAASGIFKGINFAGGEPFLLEQLPELIDVAKKKGLKRA